MNEHILKDFKQQSNTYVEIYCSMLRPRSVYLDTALLGPRAVYIHSSARLGPRDTVVYLKELYKEPEPVRRDMTAPSVKALERPAP